MPPLYLRTFGGLSLEQEPTGTTRVAVQGSRLALLAVLAAADLAVSRDRLLALLWPESDSDRARGALRQALYAFRRDLGTNDLTEGTTALRLNETLIRSDVGDFRAALADAELERAAKLYTGPFLDGIYLRDGAEFERWAERERAELAASYRSCLERLAHRESRLGDIRSAAAWWRQLAAETPTSERVAIELMKALVAAGDRELAIQHAEHYAKRIRDDLGAEPDQRVTSFANQLRADRMLTAPSIQYEGKIGETLPTSTERAAETSRIGEVASETPGIRTTADRRRLRIALGVVTTIAVAASVAVFLRRSSPPASPLIAIAPIKNETGDTSLDRVGAAVTRELTGTLAQTGRVDVADLRHVVGDDQKSPSDVMRAAKNINADRMVSSSVYKHGDSVGVDASIVSTADGRVLNRVDVIGSSSDLGSLIQRLRERVNGAVLALADTLYKPWSLARSQPPTYAAFQEFVQGLDAISRADSSAMTHLWRAATLDTSFVEAKLWLIRVAETRRGVDALFATRDTRRTLFGDSLLRSALAQRSRLVPFDAASLDYIAAARQNDWDGAYTAGQRLMAIAPTTQDAMHLFADAAKNARRYSEALVVVHKLESSSGWMNAAGAAWGDWDWLMHHFLGDHEGALAEWRVHRKQLPDAYWLCSQGLRHFAAMNDERGVDSLVAVCAKLPYAAPVDSTYTPIAEQYAAWGHMEAARRAAIRVENWVSRFVDTSSSRSRIRGAMWNAGTVHCVLGEWNLCYRAFRQIDESSLSTAEQVRVAVAGAHVGDTARTIHALESLSREAANPQSTLRPFFLTEYRAALALASGNRSEALRLLEKAQQEGDLALHSRWQTNWYFFPLHDDPVFQSMLAPIGKQP